MGFSSYANVAETFVVARVDSIMQELEMGRGETKRGRADFKNRKSIEVINVHNPKQNFRTYNLRPGLSHFYPLHLGPWH